MDEEEVKPSEESPMASTGEPAYDPSTITETADAPTPWSESATEIPVDREDEFVNGEEHEYEDSNDAGSAMGLPAEVLVLPTHMPPVLLEVRWLPPRAPTSYDGFHVYVFRDGKLDGNTVCP